MDLNSQRRRDGALSVLNAAIEAMNLAKEVSSATPAKAIFGSVSVILSVIKVRSPPSASMSRRLTCTGFDDEQNRLR